MTLIFRGALPILIVAYSHSTGSSRPCSRVRLTGRGMELPLVSKPAAFPLQNRHPFESCLSIHLLMYKLGDCPEPRSTMLIKSSASNRFKAEEIDAVGLAARKLLFFLIQFSISVVLKLPRWAATASTAYWSGFAPTFVTIACKNAECFPFWPFHRQNPILLPEQ